MQCTCLRKDVSVWARLARMSRNFVGICVVISWSVVILISADELILAPHEAPLSQILPRCATKQLQFDEHPQARDPYFKRIRAPPKNSRAFSSTGDDITTIEGRPLFGITRSAKSSYLKCTKQNVMTQLQNAIQLEWATIPTYLTTLYSIIDGYNTEIYQLIRGVVIDEMFHMVQAANILIAMNGSPLIDDASVTPCFPTRLPGGVLPGLVVNLKKLSLEHIYDTFMAVELPGITEVVHPPICNSNFTIGAFYGEIADCIQHLCDNGVELFDKTTLTRQVLISPAIPVQDAESAIAAINCIVSEGEGAGLLDPDDIRNHILAHFFKFEEIVCQRKLQLAGERFYAYTGEDIAFQEKGVWPMRDNPTVADIPPGTECYEESRMFHTTYRTLLRKLQEVFNGSPAEILETFELMESLKVHAKELMRIEFDTSTTCGPVWEYDWEV